MGFYHHLGGALLMKGMLFFAALAISLANFAWAKFMQPDIPEFNDEVIANATQCQTVISSCLSGNGTLVAEGTDAGRRGFYVFTSPGNAVFYQLPNGMKKANAALFDTRENGQRIESRNKGDFQYWAFTKPSNATLFGATITVANKGEKTNDQVRSLYLAELKRQYDACATRNKKDFDNSVREGCSKIFKKDGSFNEAIVPKYDPTANSRDAAGVH
jgi:hypothetical protein